MYRALIAALCFGLFAPTMAISQEKVFSLNSPDELVETGFLQFLLPRFSLKTGIRVVQQERLSDAVFSRENGIPVMEGLGRAYFIQLSETDPQGHEKAGQFAEWLVSDIGRRTIEQFSPNGVQVFVAAQPVERAEPALVFSGDLVRGEALAFTNCGRCHVIGTENRMKGIGSTPSFPLLRGMADWNIRFSTFYTRIPHPSITQITGVTDPFDPARPPPIYPLTLNLDELEDILTFVSTLEPADLGAPLVLHQ